jgi:cytochrome P450
MATTLVPPGPKVLFPFRLLNNFRNAPIRFLTRMTSNYGDIVYFKAAGRDVYLFNDPESIQQILVTHQHSFIKGFALRRTKNLIGEGLLTSEGELHLRQRRMIQPMFHRERIAGYAGTMVSLAEYVSDDWEDGSTLDMHAEMTHLTLLIVAKTLFDTDVESEAGEIGQVVTTLITSFTRNLGPLADLRLRLPLPSTRRILAARERLEAGIEAMIAERRAGGDRGDLLSMLIAAQDDEDGQQRMSDKQVRDEVLTLFLAGHETTANALTWSLYLLSQNPEAARQLYAELQQVLNGRSPAYEDVESLSYTRMVLSEAMRLYPPAWIITRTAMEDVEIGGYLVPKGASVLPSQWVVHHSERYYPEPFKFDPQRWTPENVAARPKMAYFPFGGGARVCIGESFAWMEGILLLATLVQKWELSLEPGFPVELLPEITLRPKYGMRMKLKRRQ